MGSWSHVKIVKLSHIFFPFAAVSPKMEHTDIVSNSCVENIFRMCLVMTVLSLSNKSDICACVSHIVSHSSRSPFLDFLIYPTSSCFFIMRFFSSLKFCRFFMTMPLRLSGCRSPDRLGMTEREATSKDDKGYSDRVGEEEWEEECEGDAKPMSGETCIGDSLAAQRCISSESGL